MSRVRVPGLRDGLRGRLQVSGVLIASGLGVELATLFWNHPVSFFLFLVPGRTHERGHVAVLVVRGDWQRVIRREPQMTPALVANLLRIQRPRGRP